MTDKNNSWLAFTVLGLVLLVFGLFFLAETPWYVQYPVLIGAVFLSIVGVSYANSNSAPS
ncbi:hypothetical protein [Natronobacterium lacisalsi]|uniref:hypothetical protein n=1 Tax=Natronobacterium lacisalsi TaxID=229731 RepID=UPI001268FBD1|nr:hypothetical protein [Halobiforma lacisalsi]